MLLKYILKLYGLQMMWSYVFYQFKVILCKLLDYGT
jgi:hypothetical protein